MNLCQASTIVSVELTLRDERCRHERKAALKASEEAKLEEVMTQMRES